MDGGGGLQVGPYVDAHNGLVDGAARSRSARSHGPLLVPPGNARLCSGQVVVNRCARGRTVRRRASSSPRGARPARPSAGPMARRPNEATWRRSARPTRPTGGLARRRRRGRTPMPFPGCAPPRWSRAGAGARALFPPARGALRRPTGRRGSRRPCPRDTGPSRPSVRPVGKRRCGAIGECCEDLPSEVPAEANGHASKTAARGAPSGFFTRPEREESR
jgi:hypothetical protein